jgi:molybdopterin/thiamine biosynthesis adenylyltransferase
MIEKIDTQLRFKDAVWFSQLPPVTIIGAGGIGSWTALLIGRAGCPRLRICDPDIYETHNMSGQLVATNYLETNKAAALASLIKDLGCLDSIKPYGVIYSKLYSDDVIISAVDNMAARKQIFDDWKARPTRKLFIDGRLLAEHYQIFCVLPNSKAELEYEKNLFLDSEVDEVPCSYKQTSHAAASIGAMITSFLINYTANIVEGVPIYLVPFKYEHVMTIGSIKIEKYGNFS